jgi:hypothetical protein
VRVLSQSKMTRFASGQMGGRVDILAGIVTRLGREGNCN